MSTICIAAVVVAVTIRAAILCSLARQIVWRNEFSMRRAEPLFEAALALSSDSSGGCRARLVVRVGRLAAEIRVVEINTVGGLVVRAEGGRRSLIPQLYYTHRDLNSMLTRKTPARGRFIILLRIQQLN